MSEGMIVFGKILEIVIIIAAGWMAQRAAFIGENAAAGLSRLVVDLAFPCLVFTQLLRTVDADALVHDWYLPLLGIAIILFSALLGMATAHLFAKEGSRSTYVFLAATPNWVFLPLPIAEALFQDRGVTIILLINVGAQLSLWTVCVAILRGRIPDLRAWQRLLASPGLIAAIGGLLIACLIPSARSLLLEEPSGRSIFTFLLAPVLKAAAGFGAITIPVALLLIGVAMGGLKAGAKKYTSELTGLALTRLLLPLPVALFFFYLAGLVGWHTSAVVRTLVCLVSCMPVAISSSVMAERYNGDAQLSARSIFLTSILSIITLPLLVILVARF